MENEANVAPKKSFFGRFWWLILLILIIIIVIAGVIWAFGAGKFDSIKTKIGFKIDKTSDSSSTSNSQANQTIPSDWQTFTNTKYKFSFRFPSDWQIQAFVGKTEDDGTGYPDYTFITKSANAEEAKDIGTLLPEKYYADSTIYTGKTFAGWAEENASNCSADAPCAHASCKKINSKYPFQTANGLSAMKFFVNYKVEGCAESQEKDVDGTLCTCGKTEREVGPIFIIDTLAKTNNTLRLIRIAPSITESNVLIVPADTWEKITNSVKFY